MRAEPTGHSWITYGSTPRVAAAPGGAVQPYIAATDLFVGQDAEVASDFTVTPLGTVLGALPVGVVVGGRMTRYTCCDQASDVGTQAARAGQSVLVANSGIAYKGTSPANAQKVVISLPLTPGNTSAFISYPQLTGEVGATNERYSYGDVRRYGIVGSGNETTKIQNAITSCIAIGYRTLQFWSATYQATGLQINAREFEFVGCGLSETTLQLTAAGALIQLDTDNGNPYTNGDYNGQGAGFRVRRMLLQYAGATDAVLANGFGNYKVGTYAVRDWRGGSITFEDSYASGFEYAFWGIQSDLNYWKNAIFGKNKCVAYLGPRSDQFTAIGCWSFQNDQIFQIEGAGGGRVYGWSTDTDGSSTTYPVVIKNFNDGAGHIRASGKWLFDGPWLENFGTTSSTQSVDAWFDIGRGDTLINDAVTIRDPNILTDFYSTVGVGRVQYLARVDQIRSLSIERPSGISGAFATNLRCLVKVQNGGASTTVPFIRCIDGDGESFRFIENYSVTAVTAMMLGWSALSYSINALGGTGTVNLTVLSDASTFARLSLGSSSDSPDPGGSTGLLRGNTFGGHNVLDMQYSQTSTATQGARVVLVCNATEGAIGTAALGTKPFYLECNGTYKWKIETAAGISYLTSVETQTRVVPGSSGLQVRNQADSADNLKVDDSGNVGARNSIGYIPSAGIGGTVAQATSKATGVTLNKACGQITMNAAALAAGAIVSFVLTDSVIKNPDLLILNHVSGGTPGAYSLNARVTADGSATIDVLNNTAGSLSEAIVIGFAILRGQTA